MVLGGCGGSSAEQASVPSEASVPSDASTDAGPSTVAIDPFAAETASLCESEQQIECIRSDDGTVIGIVLPAPQEAIGTVVFDPGGPGYEVATFLASGRVAIPTWLDSYDVVIVAEPDPVSFDPATCEEAVGAALGTVVPDQPVAAVADACGITSAGPHLQLYREHADTLMQQRAVTGLVGHSFGVIRLTPLIDEVEWSIFTAPATPGFVDGGDQRAARMAALIAALDTDFRRFCTEAVCDDGVRDVPGHELIDRALSSLAPQDATTLAYAVLMASYDLAGTGDWVWASALAAIEAGQLSPEQLDEADALQRRLVFSYGDDLAAPALARYIAGTCEAYGEVPSEGSSSVPIVTLRDAVDRLASLCQSASTGQIGAATPIGPVCLAVNALDPVVSVEAQTAWGSLIEGSQIISFEENRHSTGSAQVASALAEFADSGGAAGCA